MLSISEMHGTCVWDEMVSVMHYILLSREVNGKIYNINFTFFLLQIGMEK